MHKLVVSSPARYSEDVDLVQMRPGPIGEILDAIRSRLDPWLGLPNRTTGSANASLVYRFETESMPARRMRVKIEVNTREHFSVFELESRRLIVDNPWFRGSAEVSVYQINELFGTKLRALYQRKKGRDLFDLWLALTQGLVDPEAVVRCFQCYMEMEGHNVSRAEFERNLALKGNDPAFGADIQPLIAPGFAFESRQALDLVLRNLVARLPGAPWKGHESGCG